MASTTRRSWTRSEERGFEVAASATSSYLKTALSLLSTLNFEELDFEELEAEATGGDDFGPIHRRLQESHAVARYLHERGYRYLHVGSVRGPTAGNASCRRSLPLQLHDRVRLRPGRHDAPARARTRGAGGLRARPRGALSAQIEFQLDTLNDLADAPGRNFVFAHLLIPHPPYAFNADGSRVTDAQRASRTMEEQYLEHVRFTNASLLALVDRLHAGPPESWPIIVIAADEGPFPTATSRTRTTSSGWKRSPKSSSASSRSSARSVCPAWTVPASRTPASATT